MTNLETVRTAWTPGQIRPDQLPEGAAIIAGFDAALIGYGFVLSTAVTVYDRTTVAWISSLTGKVFPDGPADYENDHHAIVGEPIDVDTYTRRFADDNFVGSHAQAIVGFFYRDDTVELIVDRETFAAILAEEFAADSDGEDEDFDPDFIAEEMISSGSEGGWYGAGNTPLMLCRDCARCGLPVEGCDDLIPDEDVPAIP